ncbi:Orexin receptor type 1 [Lamellibrachia satsuma]|nr:Orexin receptor type 1 [Lamellibrachia satsuma]
MTNSLWRSVSPRFLQQNFAKAMKFRRRVAKMVMAIVAVFAVCWLPIHCVHLRNDFNSNRQYSNVPYIAKTVAHFMSYASSAFNPVIYAFMSDSFRQSFRAIFAERKAGPARTSTVNHPKPLPPISVTSSGCRLALVGVCRKLQMEPRNQNFADVHVTEAIPLGSCVLRGVCPERV